MDDLITALLIFRTYTNDPNPTHCEHDVMYVLVNPEDVTDEDLEKLATLSFRPDDEWGESFISYRFGSA